jgi:uncharacterized tellurite resistance protein B-like protein
MDSSAKERKILTGGLLVIGSILTFMAYSLVPWTGVPLIGAITSPIAGAIAIVVALVVLDTIFAMNQGYYKKKLEREGFAGLDGIETDINSLKEIFGKSWNKVADTISNATQKIYEEGMKCGIDFRNKSFEKHLDYEFEGLNIYVSKTSITEYQSLKTNLLKQMNSDSWIKDTLAFSTGASIGTLAGVGTSAVASSLLVPASILTTVQGFFGISTGIVVSASTYSLMTLAAPVGLGVLATVGIYSGLNNWSNKEQAAKMSKFLSEIIIAALPMAWIDGVLADQEQDTVEKLMTTSGIRKEERDLVWKAIKERKTFDEIIQTSILFDDQHRENTCTQSDQERLKHRLILFKAWEIAIADGRIEWSELQLHNRMADKLGISREEVKEIRRLINLKHDRELCVVVEVLEPNAVKTKLLKSVREQYLLQPAIDNL